MRVEDRLRVSKPPLAAIKRANRVSGALLVVMRGGFPLGAIDYSAASSNDEDGGSVALQ
jgi:hypothetical protein